MERTSDHEQFAKAATQRSGGGCLCATGWALAVGLLALLAMHVAQTRHPGGFMPSFVGFLYMENATDERVFVSATALSTWKDMSTAAVFVLKPGDKVKERFAWGEDGDEYTKRRVLISVIDHDSNDQQSTMVTCNDLFTQGIRITRDESGSLSISMVPRPQRVP